MSLFVEYKHVRQEPGGRRRWFQSAAGDLMVWYGPEGDVVTGLQFCHPERGRERVYTWRPGGSWRQQVVDEGTRPPMVKASPVLIPTAPLPLDEMRRRLSGALPGLERELIEVVRAALDAGDDSTISQRAG